MNLICQLGHGYFRQAQAIADFRARTTIRRLDEVLARQADPIVEGSAESGQFARALNRRRRMELVTTKMLDSDIANPAISGLRWPVAANGIAATL